MNKAEKKVKEYLEAARGILGKHFIGKGKVETSLSWFTSDEVRVARMLQREEHNSVSDSFTCSYCNTNCNS